MSVRIERNEVLNHLSKYGITSIDEKAFEFFIHDLKKLIKYEETRHVFQNSDHHVKSSKKNAWHNANLQEELNNQHYEACQKVKNVVSANSLTNKESCKKQFCPSKFKEKIVDMEGSTINKHKTNELDTRPNSSTSFSLHPCTKRKNLNCDPVDLYQYYQSIWRHHKLPGENDHSQLRRAIRNRLMKVK